MIRRFRALNRWAALRTHACSTRSDPEGYGNGDWCASCRTGWPCPEWLRLTKKETP